MSDLIRRDEAIKEIKKLAEYYAGKQTTDSSQFFVGEEDGCYSAIYILEEMKPVGHSTNKKDMEALIEDINPKEIASQIETDTLFEWCEILRHELIRTLNKMENAKPKTGHWIDDAKTYYEELIKKGLGVDEYTPYFTDDIACSECLAKYSVLDNETQVFKHCPNCGAKMEEE